MTKQRKTTQKCLMLVFCSFGGFAFTEKKFIGAITRSERKFLWFCEFEQGFLMNHKKTNQKKNKIVVKYSETLTCPVDIDKFEEINLFGQEDI